MPKLLSVSNIRPAVFIEDIKSKNHSIENVIPRNEVQSGEIDFLSTELFKGMSIGPGLWMTFTYSEYQLLNKN